MADEFHISEGTAQKLIDDAAGADHLSEDAATTRLLDSRPDTFPSGFNIFAKLDRSVFDDIACHMVVDVLAGNGLPTPQDALNEAGLASVDLSEANDAYQAVQGLLSAQPDQLQLGLARIIYCDG